MRLARIEEGTAPRTASLRAGAFRWQYATTPYGACLVDVRGVVMEPSRETGRHGPVVGLSELIEQLRSLFADETDLASDAPVEVLVGRQRYAVVGTQAELDDDSRAVVTLLAALRLQVPPVPAQLFPRAAGPCMSCGRGCHALSPSSSCRARRRSAGRCARVVRCGPAARCSLHPHLHQRR